MRRRVLVGGAGLASLTGLGAWAGGAKSRDVLAAPHRPDPHAWSDRGLYAAWLGHTTVLLKIDGTTILTDPVLSSRVGIDLGLLTLGLKRMVAPALALKDLP